MLRTTTALFINRVLVVAALAQEVGTIAGKIVSIDGKPIEDAIVTFPDFVDGK